MPIRFTKKFGVYPNIMLASTATWDYIDLFVNLCEPERILPPDGDFASEPGDDASSPSPALPLLTSKSISAATNALPQTAMLVFDEAPTFGGEPVDGEGEVYTLIA